VICGIASWSIKVFAVQRYDHTAIHPDACPGPSSGRFVRNLTIGWCEFPQKFQKISKNREFSDFLEFSV